MAIAAFLGLATLGVAASGAAQRGRSPLARAQSAYAEADLERALSALDEAERGELSRDELIEVLRLRVFASFALRDQAALEDALQRLAPIGPEVLEGASPRLASAYASARSRARPPVVDAQARFEDDTAIVEAHAEGGAPLVSGVEVHGRVDGGAWRSARDRLSLSIRDDARLEYYAEALGPGGAVLASAGSIDRPLELTREADRPIVAPVAAASGEVPWWPFVLGGVVLAIGAAVAIVFVVTESESNAGLELRGPFFE